MSQIRCEYCHEYIAESEYNAHVQRHTTLRQDGQQADYATLPPEQRSDDALEGVPQIYIHSKCGQATGMPTEIIQTYLENPYFYLADSTFCTGCNRHVPNKECHWSETGENLQEYTDRLRKAKPECRPGLFSRILVFFFTRNWIK